MKLSYFFILILFLVSCSNQDHFITDTSYRRQVVNDFEEVKKLSSERDNELFNVFNKDLSIEEQEALMFLIAYMPLSDMADYSGEFFLNNIKYALKTKETFPWVKDIPEDIFRHYVLPYRVNNENLDTARQVFYNELKNRLKGMSIEEAALEVNHWCHEKVTYKGTDIRTISPLAAIKSGYGRCGEESTFTVTAMRSVGIPARQCYTPRWAHSDDNHAWVEVFINGKWKYLGACEPEPVLNRGWFTGPALRAMLVHSKAFGNYSGNELITNREEKFSMINMLENYAPVKKVNVLVLEDGNVSEGATVEFQLYNYAEFYPIAKKETDIKGKTNFTTGYGDLLIWAYKENKVAYKKITVENSELVELNLKNFEDVINNEEFDFVPPITRKVPEIEIEGKELNSKRLRIEDSIRTSKEQFYISKEEISKIANNLSLDKDKLTEFFVKSRGNWSEIKDFVLNVPENNRQFILPLLSNISDKDLRDTKSQVLLGAIISSKFSNNYEKDVFNKYLLNPRVENEVLVDYKKYLQEGLKKSFNSEIEINQLIAWIKIMIKIENKLNYYEVPISPVGVFNLRIADEKSRDIFFVAACRSLGVPARLNEANSIPQFYDGKWIDVKFKEEAETKQLAKGIIKLNKDKSMNIDPKYRIHYSIAKFENGRFNTLEYGWGKPYSEISSELLVEVGNYMLLTGNRQSDGSILTKMTHFVVEEGKIANVNLSLRESVKGMNSIGKIEFAGSFKNLQGKETKLDVTKPIVIAWLDPEKEPSKHTLVDIQEVVEELDAKKMEFVFILSSKEQFEENNMKQYKLPVISQIFIDNEMKSLSELKQALSLNSNDLPKYIYVKEGEVFFLTEGYQIGIGEQLLKIQNRIE